MGESVPPGFEGGVTGTTVPGAVTKTAPAEGDGGTCCKTGEGVGGGPSGFCTCAVLSLGGPSTGVAVGSVPSLSGWRTGTGATIASEGIGAGGSVRELEFSAWAFRARYFAADSSNWLKFDGTGGGVVFGESIGIHGRSAVAFLPILFYNRAGFKASRSTRKKAHSGDQATNKCIPVLG